MNALGSSILSVQTQIAASLHQACAGSILDTPSQDLLQIFPGLTGEMKRVTSNYLPAFQVPLSDSPAHESLIPPAHASLILSLVTYWNALSCLCDSSLSPISEEGLIAGLRNAGLGASAGPIAASALAKKPTPAAMQVMADRSVTAEWFRDTLEASALWRRGVKAKVAPMLAEQVMHLARTSDRDYGLAMEATRPFRLFADEVKGARGLIPLPESHRQFLLSERFVGLALQSQARKRRTLVGFLGFAALDPAKIPGANFARFPDFESFQSDKGVWPARNNFHLHFVDSPGNVYRANPVLKRFRKAHPDLDQSLVHFFQRNRSGQDEPIERLLYEAYRWMASHPQNHEKSLVV